MQEHQSVFRNVTMKPKYYLQPLYTNTFLSRKDWIRGPTVLGTSRSLSGLQTTPGENGICRPDMRFFFLSLSVSG